MGLAELGSMAGELAVPGGVRDQTAAPANAACAGLTPAAWAETAAPPGTDIYRDRHI